MSVRFVTSFSTPKCPYGREVQVEYDPTNNEVLAGEFLDTNRPVKGRSLILLRASIEAAIERMGWTEYQKMRRDIHVV